MFKKLSIKFIDDPGYGKPLIEEVVEYYLSEGVQELLGVPHSEVVLYLESIQLGYGIGWKLYTQNGPIIFPVSIIDHLKASGVFRKPEEKEKIPE